jgi:SAM-dependent methyltransferase
MVAVRSESAPRPDYPALSERVESFVSLGERQTGFVEAVAGVSSLCIEIERAEREGTPSGAIRDTLGPARAIHRRSGLIRRLQDWPRGYPGGRILVLACGGGRDLLSIADVLRIVPGNALRVVRRPYLGRFDLVLMGGLADYLTDPQLRFLVRTIRRRLLRPRGRLLLTNIATGNPYRSWISYLADWHLRERSRTELHHLVDGPSTLERDRTGLSFLVEAGAA